MATTHIVFRNGERLRLGRERVNYGRNISFNKSASASSVRERPVGTDRGSNCACRAEGKIS